MAKSQGKWQPFDREYWCGTYVQRNPFMGAPRCPQCQELPEMEGTEVVWKHGGAVSEYTFRCAQGHIFVRTRTHD